MNFFKQYKIAFEAGAAFLLIVGLIAGTVYVLDNAHDSGYAEAKAIGDLAIETLKANSATAQAVAEAAARADEQAKAKQMSDSYNAYIAEKKDDEVKNKATLAAAQSGAIVLRKQLAAVREQLTAVSSAAQVGASSTGSESGYGPGLRKEDVDFLLRESQRADAVVKERNLCWSIAKQDRK